MTNPLVRPVKKFVLSTLQLWGRVSTQKRLLLLGLVSISALITFTAWIFVTQAQAIKSRSVNQFGQALAHALARGGAEAISAHGSVDGLKYYVLTEMAQTPAIAYIAFCSDDGRVLLNSQDLFRQRPEAEKIYQFYKERPELRGPNVLQSPPGYRELTNIVVPMRRNNNNLGVCWVGLDSSEFSILGTPAETKVFLLSIFGLVWFLGALCLAVNYALINRPLKSLAYGASQIAAGRFGHQIPGQSAGREIDQVVSAFNYMSKRLQQYDKQNLDSLMSERNKFISERNKLELVLMSIADGVVVCDRDNKVQIINAAATQLFDKDAKDLIGKPLVFCTEGPDSPQICHIIQAFTDTVSPGRLGPVMQQLNIQDRVVRMHIAPIQLKGEFLGSVMIMQDITRQAELERMKNEFISNVSHELRTPITSIKSYVDTIKEHGDKLDQETYKDFMEIIDSEADRLIGLINQVLELSKLEEADRDIEMVDQDVRLAADYTVRALTMMAKDKGVELAFVAEEPMPLVHMNRESIERAIINLLSNAIKYTPTGGTVEVSVANLAGSKEIRVSVKDNGIGIPEECLENVFDRFFRVEKKVHTIKGTGLGLTIVKNIVEKHQGYVRVTSELGLGSTFSIYLPAIDAESGDNSDHTGQHDSQVSKSPPAVELNIS